MLPGMGSVAIGTGVFVGVNVDVAVAGSVMTGMIVQVGVAVAIQTDVSVGVSVDVEYTVAVAVAVAGSTGVAAGASVRVGLGFEVGEGVAGKNIRVFVGFVVAMALWVAEETAVRGTGNVEVIAGIGVPVTNTAPGVRKRFSQAGCVNMDELTGSINPAALWVRKSLLGSRLESISAFSVQRGENRSAQPPARMTSRKPTPKIKGMINQSRRSCSGTFMDRSIVDWQAHKDRGARVCRFIVTWAFEPDAPMMSINHPARNGKPKTRSTSLEFCFSGGM
jgi:hypothetical protein